jgi:hypothetical protein
MQCSADWFLFGTLKLKMVEPWRVTTPPQPVPRMAFGWACYHTTTANPVCGKGYDLKSFDLDVVKWVDIDYKFDHPPGEVRISEQFPP